MRDVWAVKGSESAYGGRESVLFVKEDKTGRPAMMNAYGGMMKYLYDVGGTDAEEKYMDKIFVYDSWCTLLAIIVPSSVEHIPAKVIILNRKDHSARIFGTQEIIDTEKPIPMNLDEWIEAREYAINKENFRVHQFI